MILTCNDFRLGGGDWRCVHRGSLSLRTLDSALAQSRANGLGLLHVFAILRPDIESIVDSDTKSVAP